MSWRSRMTSSPAQKRWAAALRAAVPLSHRRRMVIVDAGALGEAEREVEVLQGLGGGALEEVVEGDDHDGVGAVGGEAADRDDVAMRGIAHFGDVGGDADERL